MSPSAGTDTALDLLVKEATHMEALRIASAPPCPNPAADPEERQRWRDAHEASVCRGFHRVLPANSNDPKAARTAAACAEISGYSRHGVTS